MNCLRRLRRKPPVSPDVMSQDALGAFGVVAYFDCSVEDLRNACKQFSGGCRFVVDPAQHMQIQCPQPTWTATLWESGKAVCTSVVSFEDATTCARWLRNTVLRAAGVQARTIAIAEIRDGEARIRPGNLTDLERVCRAENHEIAQTLVALFEHEVDVALLREELTAVGLANMIEKFGVDSESCLLRGVLVKPHVKELLLTRLRNCSVEDLRNRTEGSELRRIWKQSRFVRMTALIAGQVALGVLGNAVFQYVVIPLVKRFGHTHKVEVASNTPSRPETDFADSATYGALTSEPMPLDQIVVRSELPLWIALIELNLLKKHGAAAEVGGAWRRLDRNREHRIFMETEFRTAGEEPLKLDEYADALKGLM